MDPTCRTVISMVREMDLDASEAVPTCIAAVATGSGYSRMALFAGSLGLDDNCGYDGPVDPEKYWKK